MMTSSIEDISRITLRMPSQLHQALITGCSRARSVSQLYADT